MHRQRASTQSALEELQQDMIENPLLIETVEYLKTAFHSPSISSTPSPDNQLAVPLNRGRRSSSIGAAEGAFDAFTTHDMPNRGRTRSSTNLHAGTQLRRTTSWNMMEEIARGKQQHHLSPELTQMSFEMSKNYFLDYILRDKQGRSVFMQFLQQQHCAENLMFWYDVEKYGMLTDDEQESRVLKAQAIAKKYLSEDSETEVNLPYSIKQDILKNINNPSKTLFEAAQRSVFLLMVYGTLDYFLKSERYRLYKATRQQDEGAEDVDSITDEQLEKALKEAKLHKEKNDQSEQSPRKGGRQTRGPARSVSLRNVKNVKHDEPHDKKCLIS